jgi:hypothetical protein
LPAPCTWRNFAFVGNRLPPGGDNPEASPSR